MSAPTPPSPEFGPSHAPSGTQLDRLESAAPSAGERTGKDVVRVAVISENFLPKVDGVTRTLAMLLEHLQSEGHAAMVLGPATPLTSYAGAEVVSTRGIPLMGVYRGLGLNFLRPKFIKKLREFRPTVCLFVDPIFLCAQTIPAVQLLFPDLPLVSSYHTNLAMYASLFGFKWLTPPMWALQRNLHNRCDLSFCPSPSTARELSTQGFAHIRLWPRGVDVDLFRPSARDYILRQTWTAKPPEMDGQGPLPRLLASAPDSSAPNEDLPPLHLPPPYSASPASATSPSSAGSKVVVLYVGRISWEKNLRLLIEAFRGLQHPDPASGRPACQLVFVGDGPARKAATDLCEKYGLGAIFTGFRKGAELAAAYASADVFAFPSFTETFGQVVSEAQVSGLPVVGLKAEGVSDLVEHGKTGLLLDLHDLLPANSRTSTPDILPNLTPSSPFPPRPSQSPSPSTAYRAASKRSWFAAMENLVDGFRDVAAAREANKQRSLLELSRTPTLEVDVVCEQAHDVDGEVAKAAVAGSTSAVSSPSTRRQRLLHLDEVLRKTGGRLRETSQSFQPLRSWLAPSMQGEKGAGVGHMARFFEAVAFFFLLFLAVHLVVRLDSFGLFHLIRA
ncbi:hypothetical protein JCM10213_001713 [Rhodosporidiobolus nylandii]